MRGKNLMRGQSPAFVAALAIFSLVGCGNGNAAAHPNLRKAELCRKTGDYTGAQRQLRQFLASHPESAEGHLAMASLCDENLGDALGAVYHYREFLRVSPNSPHAGMVRIWLRDAMRRLLAENENLSEKKQLERTIAGLKRQNRRLAQLFHTRDGYSTRKEPIASRREQKYQVQYGDTLGSISRKFYGVSSQVERILHANGLQRDSVLRAGQDLLIPPLERE